ncbi:hypothetical protein DRP07_06780 [Archaeoglobales archaeon]|nr:MAG: hypothetical protein DRP07_06780 [Archaeoglobales archaeon]
MLKGEIILLHTIPFKVRKTLETAGFTSKYFSLYDEFKVFLQIHKRKANHKKVALILCLEILEILHEKQEIAIKHWSIDSSKTLI